MGWVLLGGCLVICPLLMGGMMLSMRRGGGGRRSGSSPVQETEGAGEDG
jgi:hypothetical protein